VVLDSLKIKKFLTPDESYREDRPYSVEEISRILDKCDIRQRVRIMERVDENWLEESILKASSAATIPNRFEIWDENNERICFYRFMKDYENDRNGYFKDFFATSKYINYDPYPIYTNEIFEMKPLGNFDSLEFFTNKQI
jgi:hypothetical protein